MLSEAHIIEYLTANFPDNIGDDAAVINGYAGQQYVVTTDLLVEDIHFRVSYFNPADLAHKALHVNLSDIAAMGARPCFILCGISIPMAQAKYAEDFLFSLATICKKAGVLLIGGDTTKSPDKLFISITAIGTTAPEYIKYRTTAAVGDYICITGALGDAHIGLIACENKRSDLTEFKNAFLRPHAKINEGQWLGTQLSVTSMMDISDGLFIDLRRLCEASNVASNIILENIVPSTSFINACYDLQLDPVTTMLIGGEDYGLLFTVDSENYQLLADAFMQRFGYQITCIGHIVAGNGVHFIEQGQAKNMTLTPFSHFGEE
ncbi:MAG: thiamine-phosphate kinase [Gammaproteobacteria bacterium]